MNPVQGRVGWVASSTVRNGLADCGRTDATGRRPVGFSDTRPLVSSGRGCYECLSGHLTTTGRLTQRLECYPHTVEVTGSNPVPPIDGSEKPAEMRVFSCFWSSRSTTFRRIPTQFASEFALPCAASVKCSGRT